MNERRSLDAVDAALDDERRGAPEMQIPPALRARILAATRPARTPAPRGRMLDFVLRAAAVAAAFAAVLLVAPVTLEAAEFDPAPLVDLNARISDSLARHLPEFDAADASLSSVPADSTWPLALVAAALIPAGLWLARREGRR
jgi:hypothetical protein